MSTRIDVLGDEHIQKILEHVSWPDRVRFAAISTLYRKSILDGPFADAVKPIVDVNARYLSDFQAFVRAFGAKVALMRPENTVRDFRRTIDDLVREAVFSVQYLVHDVADNYNTGAWCQYVHPEDAILPQWSRGAFVLRGIAGFRVVVGFEQSTVPDMLWEEGRVDMDDCFKKEKGIDEPLVDTIEISTPLFNIMPLRAMDRCYCSSSTSFSFADAMISNLVYDPEYECAFFSNCYKIGAVEEARMANLVFLRAFSTPIAITAHFETVGESREVGVDMIRRAGIALVPCDEDSCDLCSA